MIGNQKVPSYGGWIEVQNLPLDKWPVDIFKKIGDGCERYLETTNKILSRMDMMEIGIKVKENFTGFIPVKVHLPLTSNNPITVKIDPFFVEDYNIGYITSIHGKIPSSPAEGERPRAREPKG